MCIVVNSISWVDANIRFISPKKIHSELSSRSYGTMDKNVWLRRVSKWNHPVMVNGIRTIYPDGLNEGYSLKFCLGPQVQCETPVEDQRTYR